MDIKLWKIVLLGIYFFFVSAATASTLKKIIIEGNRKVESSSIKSILKSKSGKKLSKQAVADDIRTIFDLGFFSDVRVFESSDNGGVILTFRLVEKPSIIEIKFEGMDEVGEDDIEEKLTTKVFTILDESKVAADLRMIEKTYYEKGFFLALASYEVKKISDVETVLIFTVDENGKILVGDVDILGNRYFSDSELSELMATRPTTRSSMIGSSSLFQEAFVKRDLEFLSYYYQDFGFAEVKVGKPIINVSADRKFANVTFSLDEGTQFWLGEISFAGDLLFSEEELKNTLSLNTGDMFKMSRFRSDIDALMDKYGDLGYAYVDINPKTSFDRDNAKVNVKYVITKGPKVYFGLMQVVGNTKTRDNVIRREMDIADGDLYSRIGLRQSKSGIERLGFFESVQILQERDLADDNRLNLKIKIEEKATGQLRLAAGYSPSGVSDASWFGEGKYEEKNQSGKGWNVNLTGKTDGGDNYNLNLGFGDPRVNDSLWSASTNLAFEQLKRTSVGFGILEKRRSLGFTVGRNIIEKIRGSMGLTFRHVSQQSEQFLSDFLSTEGDTYALSLSLSRTLVDNYIDPTDGTRVSVTHKFVDGDYKYMESVVNGAYYYPVMYTASYKTYFKLSLTLGKLYSLGGEQVPIIERYKLGGANDLRAYNPNSITPYFPVYRNPFETKALPKGGDRELLFQAEYYMPLVPQAGIKALLFFDAGRVYDNGDAFEVAGLVKDVGFGIRWTTPIAPFRFEWAFPVDQDGNLGKHKFVFNFGY